MIDRGAGAFGIRLLTGALTATVCLAVFVLALRLVGDRLRAAGLTLAALLGFLLAVSPRPLLMGAALLVVLIWVVEIPDSSLGRHAIVVISAAIWIWANVHGTWILGIGYLALHLVGRWSEGAVPWSGRERKILTGALIGSALTLVNPYGWRLVVFPVTLLGRGSDLRRLGEWASPDFARLRGWAFAIWLTVFIVVIGRAVGARCASRRDFIVAIPFLLLALFAVRNAALAPLVTLPIACRAVATSERRDDTSSRSPLALGFLSVLVLGMLAVTTTAWFQSDFDFRRYPVAALDEVESQGLIGRNLLTTDVVAGYLILEQWPQQRVFVDDRIDMYPPEVVDAYFALLDGTEDWQRALDDYEVEVVVWPSGGALTQLLEESPRWQRAYVDDDTGVWVRREGSPG